MSVADQLKAELEKLDADLPKPDEWDHLLTSGDPEQILRGLAIQDTVMLSKIAGTLMIVAKQVEWIESVLGEPRTESATTPTCENTGSAGSCPACHRPMPLTNAERQRRYRERKRDG